MVTDPVAGNTTFGRFSAIRELGRGAAGTVYLAMDPHLNRQVAIKTIGSAGNAMPGPDKVAAFLEEARIASTLSHPNIVPLYDAGEQDATAYLVYEYVQGQTLADLIHRDGRLDIDRAVQIVIDLGRGVAYAHERNVLHRNLKPANVMITPDGEARLMDFGIPPHAAAGGGRELPFAGTPSYLAPECLKGEQYLPAGDVFALGAILYEMLTGAPPVRGADARDTAQRMLEEEFEPPSLRNPNVDERLDDLLMKALAKSPQERFAGAGEMAGALAQYLQPEAADGIAEPTRGTLDYLLRRIRHKGDFPAVSATISAINRAVSSDREPASVLSNSILKDLALTSRLLKIVNASNLRQFGGSISTVSRAVSILGFDTVRNVSMSLVLFEHMHDRANAAALKDQVVSIYFSALLARQLHSHAGLHEGEQAFICAMFHRLGKLLATFYLYDEAQVVERHVQNRGWDEARAAREVLGLSYEELGVGVGKAWNFPVEITDSMRVITGKVRKCPAQKSEKLRMVASLANELSDIIQNTPEAERSRALDGVVGRYGAATGISPRTLIAAVQASTSDLVRDADTLGHGVARSNFFRSAQAWQPATDVVRDAGDAGQPADCALSTEVPPAPANPAPVRSQGAEPAGGTTNADEAQQLVASMGLEGMDGTDAAPSPPDDSHRRRGALVAGIQDITNTLVGDHTLSDVLRIVLETMYQAIGFQRVLLFVLDGRMQVLRCRFGFGLDADRLVQAGVSAPLGGKRDLFYAAITMGADLCIEDLHSEKMRRHVPGWYRDAIGARGILLLPIVSQKRTLGLIYADSDSPENLRFSAEELGLLKTLRNQALLAMRALG